MNIGSAITAALPTAGTISISPAINAASVFHDMIAGCSAGPVASIIELQTEPVFGLQDTLANAESFSMVPSELSDATPHPMPECLAEQHPGAEAAKLTVRSQSFNIAGQMTANKAASALPAASDDATAIDEDKENDVPPSTDPVSSGQPATGMHNVPASPPKLPFIELKMPVTSNERVPSTMTSLDVHTATASLKPTETQAIQSPVLPPIAQSPASILTAAAPEFIASGHVDLARDTLWLDHLAKEIVAVASHDGKLRFSLSPQALGDLDVAISTQSDGVHIQLQTSTESAARIFAAEQPKLAEELRQSGVRLVNNDLFSGQHMGSGRDQSHMPSSGRHLPMNMPQPRSFNSISHSSAAPPRGRFA
jgi:flagellar hook-length control protein FliK